MSSPVFGIFPPSPPSPPHTYDEDHADVGRFGYGIGVSIGVLLLIITITLASYFCSRTLTHHRPPRHRPADVVDNGRDQCAVDLTGLDEATIKSYPKILYSEATKTTSSCCSICLADYKGNDLLRRLPECNHLFHTKCVDPWLRMNATCPVCRTSPLPTPVSTPLNEITPLAAGSSVS